VPFPLSAVQLWAKDEREKTDEVKSINRNCFIAIIN